MTVIMIMMMVMMMMERLVLVAGTMSHYCADSVHLLFCANFPSLK